MTAPAALRSDPHTARRVAIPVALDPRTLTPPAGGVATLGGATMGTTWSVTAVGLAGARLADARTAIDATLDRVVRQMSTWIPTSDISAFNGSAGEWRALPRDFAVVLRFALDVARASGGAYDPTIGPLVECWGFGPSGPRCDPPDEAEVSAARARCGWYRIDVAQERARQPGGCAIDLSSVAKGFGVDAVASTLDGLGVESYLVEIGGELRGRGLKADAQPWWVAVEPPVRSGESVESIAEEVDLLIALHGLAVASSGDYRRAFERDGHWYSHTIDPRTGRPVTHGLASVSVLHSECMAADAWSTALMTLGPDQGLALAERERLAAFFVTRTSGGLETRTSSALEAMLG